MLFHCYSFADRRIVIHVLISYNVKQKETDAQGHWIALFVLKYIMIMSLYTEMHHQVCKNHKLHMNIQLVN